MSIPIKIPAFPNVTTHRQLHKTSEQISGWITFGTISPSLLTGGMNDSNVEHVEAQTLSKEPTGSLDEASIPLEAVISQVLSTVGTTGCVFLGRRPSDPNKQDINCARFV